MSLLRRSDFGKKKLISIGVIFSIIFFSLIAFFSIKPTIGTSSVNDSIEIQDWHDLDEIRENLQTDYVLVSDLDENTAGYNELVDTEEGWEPIGDENNPFKGTFRGQNNEIKHIFVNKPTEGFTGVFGVMGDSAKLENINVIEGELIGSSGVGGLVGYNKSGEIKNSYSNAKVEGSVGVGGLVGINKGIIFDSYAKGNINGDDIFTGGLVGLNENGNIIHSFAESEVSGVERVGGLAGATHSSGKVVESYSKSKVSGNNQVGGLVGTVGDIEAEVSGNIVSSYSIGEVSGEENVGGLVGLLDMGEISHSFSDNETSKIKNPIGSGEGENVYAIPTENMQRFETYTDEGDYLDESWDITTIETETDKNKDYTWNIVDGETYPFLSWEEEDLKAETLKLEAGWNLFSLPLDPENAEAGEVFDEFEDLPTIYGWNGSYDSIGEGDNLELGEGYWVYAEEPKEVTVIGEPVEELTLELDAGWNLAGIPGDIAPVEADEVFEEQVPTIYDWDGSYGSIGPGESFDDGQGYWIYAEGKKKISID